MIQQLNSWAESLLTVGSAHFVQVALMALLLAALDFGFGRRLGPRWRFALWLLFLVKLVLPPNLALPTSPAYWVAAIHESVPARRAYAPMLQRQAPAQNPVVRSWSAQESASLETVARAVAQPRSGAEPSLTWRAWVALAWLAGVIAFVLVTVLGHLRLRRALSRSRTAGQDLLRALVQAQHEVGLRSAVALRISSDGVGPLVCGIWRPVIHLPEVLVRRLSAEQLHSVLVHELLHVARGDLWIGALQALVRAVFFHHPAVWWFNTHVTRIREEATDAAVLSHAAIDPRTYSLALVEAASLRVPAFPSSHFALGVIETKTQLERRITMNLQQSRPARREVGLRGTACLALLALVLIPMAPGQSAVRGQRPRPGFQTVEPAKLTQRIDASTKSIMDAFNKRDSEAYAQNFVEDAWILPDADALSSGRAGVRQTFFRVPPRLVYEPMVWAERQLYAIGDWVVDTGLVNFRFRLAPEAPVMEDPRACLTIWQQAGGQNLRVKLLSWNRLAKSDVFNQPLHVEAYAEAEGNRGVGSAADREAVLQAEEAFHTAIKEKRHADAAAFYADDATLLLPQSLPLRSKAAIEQQLQASSPAVLTNLERQVAHIEGDASRMLVINLFRWTFTHEGTVPVPVDGKGVHVWQKGVDGKWRILFDLPNASQRAN